MASKYPPGYYDEEKLCALESAYRQVWKTISMEKFLRDPIDEDLLRKNIIDRLMSLVSQGITNADQLRARTLMEFGSERPRD
jgi:hypothetical protein